MNFGNYFSSIGPYIKNISSYEVFIGNLLLPLAPKRIEITRNDSDRKAVLIEGGDISILRDPALTEIQFEVIIPQGDHIDQGGLMQKLRSTTSKTMNTYTITRISNAFTNQQKFSTSAELIINYLDYIKELKCVVPFIVFRSFPNIPISSDWYIGSSIQVSDIARHYTNIQVSLGSYTTIDDYNEGKDMGIRISLKQYKYKGTKRIKEIVDGKYEVIESVDAPDLLRYKYIISRGRDTLFSTSRVQNVNTVQIISLNTKLFQSHGLWGSIPSGEKINYAYY